MFAAVFESNMSIVATVGILFSFFATVLLLWKCKDKLPRDLGRDFAVDGKLSAGKPRGAGFLFVLIFAAAALIWSYVDTNPKSLKNIKSVLKSANSSIAFLVSFG